MPVGFSVSNGFSRSPSCIALRLIGAMLLLAGCGSPPKPQIDQTSGQASNVGAKGASVEAVDMNAPLKPEVITTPIQIGVAKNEWTSFAVQLRGLGSADSGHVFTLRIQPARLLSTNQTIAPENFSAFQVLPMPVDANRAGYVRHTGLPTAARQLPRALVPMPMDHGAMNVSALRDPAHPFDPTGRVSADPAADPPVLWVDLHVPAQTKPGLYSTTCDLSVSGQNLPVAQLQVSFQVFDFVIPDERHLLMVSQIDWDSLQRIYTDSFEAITPRLINRHDDTYASAVKTMDQLIDLAESNRTEAVVPRLQPTVKWPAGQSPQVDWSDFDSLVGPWLSGEGFADKTALGYWPLPAIDYLNNFDAKSQHDYWSSAAAHFNQKDWLQHSAVFVDKNTPGRARAMESVQLSDTAGQILGAHPLLRVTVPLEDEQIQFQSQQNPGLIDPKNAGRVMAASTGIVFASPMQNWPDGVAHPQHWLRTDLPGLVPYAGAGGDERDVRLWAWLAYLKHANLILWTGALPRQEKPTEPADPNELVWFYPGKWFGLDEPVPSIQLKWLRRAQQDYEYLYLAAERGMPTNALMLARLMTKQVQIQPGQNPDPEYGLLTGTVEQKTWDEAQALLARTILLRTPGQSPDDPVAKSMEVHLNLDTIRWQAPKERPFVMPRTTQWLWDDPSHVVLRLGVDIYNGGDNRPDRNLLKWISAGDGWEFRPQPVVIGSLQTYWVQRFNLEARLDLDKIAPTSRKPMNLSFVDGYTKSDYRVQAMVPVATSDRREGRLKIDGDLSDWDSADLVEDGHLIKMLDRPSVQKREISPASVTSQIYTGWADENFYVAFRLNGMSTEGAPHRNFLDYQFRRVWGEDAFEILIQPVYNDSVLGPITHLVCKPNGVVWVERKVDSHMSIDPWAPMENTAVRYAADPEHGPWTGEVAIPWKILKDPGRPLPKLLRINFSQHLASNGESASWTGPVDFGRDDSMMGLVYLRENSTPGMKDTRAQDH